MTSVILMALGVWVFGVGCGVLAMVVWLAWQHRQHEQGTLSERRMREGYRSGSGRAIW